MAQKSHPSLTAHLLKDPLQPFPWYRIMCEQHPIYYSPEFNSWFVIGAPLARLETKIALEALLRRFTNIKRVKAVPLRPVASSFVYGVKSLPVTFREVL